MRVKSCLWLWLLMPEILLALSNNHVEQDSNIYGNVFPARTILKPENAGKPEKYWIEFTDKNQSPWHLSRPQEFLSARALERRARAGIPVDELDLPVSPAYVQALRNLGLDIHGQSRWLNAVSVLADSATVEQARSLPFVKHLRYLGPHLRYLNPPNRPTRKRSRLPEIPQIDYPNVPEEGYATRQNDLLGTPVLRMAGFRGQGIWVAVMDGGFNRVDTLPFFDSLALSGRMFQGRDFVERDTAVFETSFHGTSVLSVMGGNLPGYFVGTAPDATYFLLKTEDTGGEFPIEEANWVAGAEWADSIGVDIINASLGYTVFNNPQLGHRHEELDGRTAIASRGAAIAASRGMIICNSAGNEGDETWRKIGVPADAPGIISVGAVDDNGQRADFSSMGPTADGRIKPDLMAPGATVVTAGTAGAELGMSSGTSLASPMLAGSLAALWSAFPEKTAREIQDAVFATADQSQNPDTLRGWGLPNMTRALIQLGDFVAFKDALYSVSTDRSEIRLLLQNPFAPLTPRLELRDLSGNIVPLSDAAATPRMISMMRLSATQPLLTGVYQLVLFDSKGQSVERLPIGVW